MNTENLLIKQPARYGESAPDPIDGDWCVAWGRHRRSLTVADLYEECNEYLLQAVKSGDAGLVGRVLMAAVNTRLLRAADREVYGDTSRPDSEDAAAAELHRDMSPLLRASISTTKGI